MRRSLIRQGTGSYTLTVPKDWVDKHRLAKDAVVDVVEKDASLLITPQPVAEEKAVSITLPRILYTSTLWHAVLSAYVAGYQEIVLLFPSPHCIRIDRITYEKTKASLVGEVQEIMTLLIGMEVIRQAKDCIVINELATGNPERFTSMLNRAFYIMEELIDETYQALIEQRKELALHEFFATGGVNKLHQYCLRLLQQYGYGDYDKTIFVARLLTAMDELSNQVKNLLRPRTRIQQREEEHVRTLKAYLERARESLQKKRFDDALVLMQEVKDVRISLKSQAVKDCYDVLNEIVQHVMECVI
ncbi:hypothetical protein JXA12_00770 [Candidatus Woesearchaeota archaeon]|nr:hypothetical protein [Candidatus Woesearchaeota archaeon]